VPGIEIRVPADNWDTNGRKYGLIEIKRGSEDQPAGFSAILSVKAAADIDQEFEF
jgi:hypothetical protein